MKVLFNLDKSLVVFVHETTKEYLWLSKFPAFTRPELYHCVPAILPIAYNVVSRLRRAKQVLKFDPAVLTWLDSDFQLKPLPASFNYHTSPKDFQDIALRFLYTMESAGILLDPGMGKSKVALDYIFLKGFKRAIIVCPRALLFVWEDEIQKHRPELSYHTVLSTDWEVEKVKVLAAQVTIVNYDKVVRLKHRIKEIGYEFIHVDEFLIKDPTTLRTKTITELSKSIPYRAGGSGTLINNSTLDAFAPVRYLHPSLTGGDYHKFLGRYTVQKEMKGSAKKIVVATREDAEVKAMLESCCIVMTKEKWLKLPEKVFKDVVVAMSDEQRETYLQLACNMYVNVQGKDLYVDNALVMLAKLYQISNGFLYINKESEDEVCDELLLGETIQEKRSKKTLSREVVFFPQSPKIEALERILTRDLTSKKAIIWFNMGGELSQILPLLQKLGSSYLIIKGGEKDIGGKVRRFNKDASIQWLVCQAKSVNYGITVLGSKKEDLEAEGLEVFPGLDSSVCNEVFFSMNFSLEIYRQQQDRIHRLGQEHVCTYYRIFSNSSVERKIREAIEAKISISNYMLVDVAETLLKEAKKENITIQ